MLEFSKDNIIFEHFHTEKQDIGLIMKTLISIGCISTLALMIVSCSTFIKDKEEIKKISSDLIEEATEDAAAVEV